MHYLYNLNTKENEFRSICTAYLLFIKTPPVVKQEALMLNYVGLSNVKKKENLFDFESFARLKLAA